MVDNLVSPFAISNLKLGVCARDTHGVNAVRWSPFQKSVIHLSCGVLEGAGCRINTRHLGLSAMALQSIRAGLP